MGWKRYLLVLTSLSPPAAAAELSDSGVTVRLRQETVELDQNRADALTLRTAAFGAYEPHDDLTVFGEVEAVAVLYGNFDDGEGDPNGRPVIPDPASLKLNQAYIEGRPTDATRVRIGRQRINFGEQRFIGDVAFRQNDQTFDAARATVSLPFGATVDVAQLLGVNRPLGPRDQDDALDGKATLIRTEIGTPFGRLTAFRYDLDLKQDDVTADVPGADSVTHGLELQGRWGREETAFVWTGALAQQENELSDTTAPYGKAEAQLVFSKAEFSLRYERLGGGEEAFQTPLGTNHAFQGHADLFLVTPEEGIEDLSFGWRIGLGDHGPVRGLHFKGRLHDFGATETDADYGDELDLTIGWRTKHATFSIERAAYRAEDFAEDQTRWWFTASTKF